MTYHRNRPFTVPRIKDDTRRMPLSRSKFLDGTVWSYFAPGQTFQCQKDEYEEPTDWPRAGSLLRVPQVVWLTAHFPNISSRPPSDGTGPFVPNPPYSDRTRNIQDGFDADEIPATASTFHDLIVDGSDPLARTFVNNTTWNTIPNESYFAQVRLEAAFAEAKERIEAIRPNRTWVRISTFHVEDYSGDDPDLVVSRYVHIASPDRFRHYFGTNFTHIFIGFPALGILDLGGPGAPGWDYTFTGPGWALPADDPFFAGSLARVIEADPRFASYKAYLYGYSLDWADPPDGDDSYWDGGSSTEVGSGAAAVAALELQSTNGNAYLEATATELEDYGFTYRGTDEPTADDLVALIAERYGFDPDTGADLG